MSTELGTEMHTGIEIERRFVVPPDALDVLIGEVDGISTINQGYYLAPDADFNPQKIRIRSVQSLWDPNSPTAYEWVHKDRLSRRRRTESEQPLNKEQFEKLWPLTAGWRFAKERWLAPALGNACAIDLFVFGLTVAEFEFKRKRDARELEVPDWCGSEVTGLKGWGSSGLAKRPMAPEELDATLAISAQRGLILPR